MSSAVAVSAMPLTNGSINGSINGSAISPSVESDSDLIDESIAHLKLAQTYDSNSRKLNGHSESESTCGVKCNGNMKSQSEFSDDGVDELLSSQFRLTRSPRLSPRHSPKKTLMIGKKNDDNSPPTLCSSPEMPEVGPQKTFDESLLEERFYKLGFTSLVRHDSPIIQINAGYGDEDDEGGLCRGPLIRSTSLKTGKTPPGTPRKKYVRFADALGLDLESVRYIVYEELPVVPQSAFRELKTHDKASSTPWFMQNYIKSPQPKASLILEFIQPGSLLNFMDRVRTNRVCLENCMVSNSAGNLSVTCIIRVLNVSFEKSVVVRYTINEWLTWNEALASHIPKSCDGWSDKFTVTFSLSTGGYFLAPGQRLLFAICYTTNTEEFWDNNMGLNYSMTYRV